MMPPQSNPLHVANLAQQMSRNADATDAKLFQKIAIVSMGCVALASISQVLLELLRRKDKPSKDHRDR